MGGDGSGGAEEVDFVCDEDFLFVKAGGGVWRSRIHDVEHEVGVLDGAAGAGDSLALDGIGCFP